MTDDIEIRTARDDELERVVRLRWLWTTELGGTADIDESAFVTGAAAWARAHRETHVPHVAVGPDGAIVGMAWLALTPRVASTHSLDRWSGDLQSCYVLPERRNGGIGGRLVEAVLATARARGAEHVTVHTSAGSVRMYARHGFQPNDRLLWADASIAER
ncbi:GNAT family N-acetyltransferase [Microbacterium kyungheense]|uniref:Acetyltransferase (GNAT) family protein n=1 Tax=Microbacterium kyungheense TaxID=1263636 RepID=A0A543F1S9_9MICO|nr:GNAT family N-acetyltransferase [Microbacterium kyungheense]TQM27782.1 acetyltransferase (GNAT) family protein [Microbacterium kyungheense]